MKKTLLILISLMSVGQIVLAQESVLDKVIAHNDTLFNIQKDYNETKEWIDGMGDPYTFPEGMSDDKPNVPAYYMVDIEENYPGTGMHHEKVYIYHSDQEGISGEEVFPPQRIVFAKTNYNFAARNYYEEYLYDSKGRIEYIYASHCVDNVFPDTEFRLYFKSGKLIKLIVMSRKLTESEELEISYIGKKVPERYADTYNSLLHKSGLIKKMFEAINGYQYNNL